MTAVYVICFFAIAVGIVFIFGMTPDSVTNDVIRIFEKEETLREKALKAQGKKRSRKLTAKISRIRDSLVSSGKSGQFSLACTAALALMAIGCVALKLVFTSQSQLTDEIINEKIKKILKDLSFRVGAKLREI